MKENLCAVRLKTSLFESCQAVAKQLLLIGRGHLQRHVHQVQGPEEEEPQQRLASPSRCKGKRRH